MSVQIRVTVDKPDAPLPPPHCHGLHLPNWTAIAERVRKDRQHDKWSLIPGAPIGLADAQKLRDAGHLLMAQRRDGALWKTVVKTPRRS